MNDTLIDCNKAFEVWVKDNGLGDHFGPNPDDVGRKIYAAWKCCWHHDRGEMLLPDAEGNFKLVAERFQGMYLEAARERDALRYQIASLPKRESEQAFDEWCESVKDCGHEVQPNSATARQRKLGWDAAMATKRESVELPQSEAVLAERARCARIAREHADKSKEQRKKRFGKLSSFHEDARIEIEAEERGEAIAGEQIAKAIYQIEDGQPS